MFPISIDYVPWKYSNSILQGGGKEPRLILSGKLSPFNGTRVEQYILKY